MAENGTVNSEQVVAHPLWQSFHNLILSSFPEARFPYKGKNKVRQLVVDMKPSPTKQHLIEALIKIRAEKLELKYLLQLAQEFENQGVALQGKVGLLELKALEEQLEKIAPEVTPQPISLWLNDDGISQSSRLTTGLLNANSTGLNGDESSSDIHSKHFSTALFSGELVQKNLDIERQSNTLGPYAAKLQAYGGAQMEGQASLTGKIPLHTNDQSIKSLEAEVGVAAGIGTKVGAKAVADFKHVDAAVKSELWAGARGRGTIGIEAATSGVKISAETSVFAGLEVITEGSVSFKSDFSQYAGLSGSVRFTKSIGAGAKANVHASIGRRGGSLGAGAGVTAGLGAHLRWSVTGDSVGSKVLLSEAAGKAVHHLGSAPYSGAINQYGRTIALDDRLTTLKERINHRLDALEVPDIHLQRQLDEGTFRQGHMGTDKVYLTDGQQAALADTRSSSERVADQLEVIRRDALNQHYS